jgi:hypothetical protein
MIGCAIVAILFIGFGLNWLVRVKPTQGYIVLYVQDDVPETLVRTLPNPAPTVPIDKVFSQQNLALYKEGRGRKINLVIKDEQGQVVDTFKFDLPPQTAEEFTSVPKATRQRQVGEKQGELTKLIASFSAPPAPREKKFMIFLDDTNGVGPDMNAFLSAKVAEMGIQDTVKNGDNATVSFYRLTASFFTQGTMLKTVKIPAKSPAGTGASEITSAIAELTQTRGKQMYSSISTGLFNALAENRADANTRVLVISDGLEHTPDTAQLDNRRLTPAQIEADATELAEKLQAFKRVPALKGARIDWFLPPRTDRARQMMAVLDKVWLPLLREAGAKIEMHY